jgi:hypothetical protein
MEPAKPTRPWNRRVRRGQLLVLLGLLIGACYSWPTYQPPTSAEVRLRLNYLERVIGEGAAPATTLGKLTRLNPEWGLFTLAFSTYALANLAAQQPTQRAEAAAFIGQAIRVALSDPIRQPFGGAEGALPSSVLYLGHLNLMLGCHRQLVPTSPYGHLHDSLSAALAERYQQEPSGNLASYPGQRWIPDNIVALASLALYSQLGPSQYHQATRHWVALAKARLLDPATGLLASQVDA